MNKLKSEFTAEARKLTAQLAPLGINGRELCRGMPDSVQGLAQAVNTLRMTLINYNTAKDLGEWEAEEKEVSKIIEKQKEIQNLAYCIKYCLQVLPT